MQKQANSVQKQPNYLAVSLPIVLDEAFPAYCTELFKQGDRPITTLHWHNALEIGFCHKGCGIFIVESKILPFSKGDVMVITSNENHLARSKKNSESEWSWIYCDPVKLLAPTFRDHEALDLSGFYGPRFSNIFSSDTFPAISKLVADLVAEFRSKEQFHNNAIRSMVYLLLIAIQRARTLERHGSVPEDVYKQGKSIKRIRPAIDYLCNNFHKTVGIGQLSRLCCMSETNFRRLFYSAMQAGPLEYLIKLRISMAAVELKNSSRSISEVAFACGFNTLSSFNLSFKSIMKKTPREWRSV
jgi:AraC family transcriptional regulator, activator of mtrCDE